MIPHPKCENCIVRWKNCGLKPETCSKTYPITDKEIEFILQMNENLPTDEMELQIRDMLVMEVRERTNNLHIAQSPTKNCPKCGVVLCKCGKCHTEDCNGYQDQPHLKCCAHCIHYLESYHWCERENMRTDPRVTNTGICNYFESINQHEGEQE